MELHIFTLLMTLMNYWMMNILTHRDFVLALQFDLLVMIITLTILDQKVSLVNQQETGVKRHIASQVIKITVFKISQTRVSLIIYFAKYCYCLQRSCGKVMFLHMSVILFTGDVSHNPTGRKPPGQTPLGSQPPGQTPPAQCMLGCTQLHSACWDTVNKQVVCILLECILV